LEMLDAIISDPVFSTLRTEHQLGYVVFGWVSFHRAKEGVVGEVRVLVQGDKENPDKVEELIESTVRNITSQMAELDPKEFEMRKHSLNVQLNKKDPTMSAFAGKYWDQIWYKSYCFEREPMMLKYLNSDKFKSPAPLLDAWKRTVAPGAGQLRKKVTVKLFAQEADSLLDSLEQLPSADHGEKIFTDFATAAKWRAGEDVWPNEDICRDPLSSCTSPPITSPTECHRQRDCTWSASGEGSKGTCDAEEAKATLHWAVDGCPQEDTHEVINWAKKQMDPSGLASVRCCSNEGTSCRTHSLGCLNDKTWAEASEACADVPGFRLCTRQELNGGVCCDTGCNFNGVLVWAGPETKIKRGNRTQTLSKKIAKLEGVVDELSEKVEKLGAVEDDDEGVDERP